MKLLVKSLSLMFVLYVALLCTVSCTDTKNVANSDYHKTWQDKNIGYKIGQIGAIQYLIDENDNRIGGGYHSYYKKNGIIYGELGALIEVVIDANGKINNDGGVKKAEQERFR